MRTCESCGEWMVLSERTGRVTGELPGTCRHWVIEPHSDGRYRLTVFPDDTTYGWLDFRSQQEAQAWVMNAIASDSGDSGTSIAQQILSWLTANTSAS